MTYEVELKFPLTNTATVEALRQRIAVLGAQPSQPLDQRDIYFAHPSRDFAQTDEVFRLRCVGVENFLTYKGPLVDQVAKTRREIEVPAASGQTAREQLLEMFASLGFREVRDVVKRREPFHLRWQDRDLEVVIDNVRDLGWFAELEIIAEDSDRNTARECLVALSQELNLGKSERRSYLRLLLEKDGAA
ncbi:MAG: class IV adenylate cyclase [Planctomycetaceae bacterium]|nr:class IV adenylate cyclase [Planctomycetaceae bacterium]